MSHQRGPLADPKVQAELKKEESAFGELDRADLEMLLRTEWGRRMYYRLVYRLAGVDSKSFSTNGSWMAFCEGRRDVGITLRDEAMRTYPDLWVRMISERTSEESARIQKHQQIINTAQKRHSEDKS